jgi:VCBS repeat-containing protein
MDVNGSGTLTFSALGQINGDLNTNAAANVVFTSTSTGTITSGLNINGNGIVNLQANRQIGGIGLNHGTLNTNATTQTWGSFNSTPCCTGNLRVLNLGSSIINCSGSWGIRQGQNLTVNAGTSQINMTGVNTTFNTMSGCCEGSSSHVYNNVSFTANSGTVNFNHFYNSSGSFANSTYNQVTFGAGANITGEITLGTLNLALNGTYNFQAGRTVTVNNLLNANATCAGPMTIQSGTAGTQAIIAKSTTAVVNINYCNIKDINFIGGTTPTATNSINQGNNSGITIQAGGSSTSRTHYWVG